MTSARPSEITFTPGMAVGDSTALAWMQQVTLRLRREVSWDWPIQHRARLEPTGSPYAVDIETLNHQLLLLPHTAERRTLFATP